MALPYFTEPDKIQGRRFGYGLGPYYPQLPDFTESVELSLYVDDQGVLNRGNTLLLHPERDPIDCVEVPKFDKKNKFIEGLSNTLDTLPTGTIILYPHLPSRSNTPEYEHKRFPYHVLLFSWRNGGRSSRQTHCGQVGSLFT